MKNDDESKLCFEEMNKRFKELNQFSLTWLKENITLLSLKLQKDFCFDVLSFLKSTKTVNKVSLLNSIQLFLKF